MKKIRTSLFALVVAASATAAATAGAQSTAPANGQPIERSKSDSGAWKGRRHKERDREDRGREEGDREERGREGMGRHGLLRGVKPTDAQKAQIKAIHEKYEAQFKSAREAMKPAFEEAKAARQRGDTAAARAAFAKTAESRQQVQALRAQESGEIRAILTPEQQKTFDANVARMKARGDHEKKERGDRDDQ